jgi:hypothetical protein
MFSQRKPPPYKWLETLIQTKMGLDKTASDEIFNLLKNWKGGYSSGIAKYLSKFPPNASIPVLVYSFSIFKPVGFLELGREVYSLVFFYKKNNTSVVLPFVRNAPEPSFISALSSFYDQDGILSATSYLFFHLAGALSAVNDGNPEGIGNDVELRNNVIDLVDIINSRKNYWQGRPISNEITKILNSITTRKQYWKLNESFEEFIR